MARKPREDVAGAIQHVFARGNNRHAIFLDDRDRHMYLGLLRVAAERAGWHCLGYCLMDNHIHLLVETPKPTLGVGMQRLHGTYARRFNDRHNRSGHVFQGRYGSTRIADDPHLWVTTRYIALNPVEAGRCRAAGDWPWSSHALLLRGTEPPWVDRGRLLSYFGAVGGDPWMVYRTLVDGDVALQDAA